MANLFGIAEPPPTQTAIPFAEIYDGTSFFPQPRFHAGRVAEAPGKPGARPEHADGGRRKPAEKAGGKRPQKRTCREGQEGRWTGYAEKNPPRKTRPEEFIGENSSERVYIKKRGSENGAPKIPAGGGYSPSSVCLKLLAVCLLPAADCSARYSSP